MKSNFKNILKEANTMDTIFGKRDFQNRFPYFQQHMLLVHIGIASTRQLQCVPTTYEFFHHKLFENKISTTYKDSV